MYLLLFVDIITLTKQIPPLKKAKNMTSTQIELQNFLNSFAKEEMKKDGLIHTNTDIQYWIDQGVNSVEDYQRMEAQSYHYDLFKEVHGIRPRWYKYSEMTAEEIWKDVDFLEEQHNMQVQMEKEAAEIAKKEHKERIKKNAYKPNLAFSSLKDLIEK